jgi:DNA-binding NarL/FixJ family response regulator
MPDTFLKPSICVSVLIADSHDIFLAGLARIIRSFPFVRQVNVARNAEELLSLLQHSEFDLILSDSGLPPLCATDLLKKIYCFNQHVKCVFMNMLNDPALAWRLLQSGAHGFLLKTISSGELAIGLQTVLHNRVYLSHEVETEINSINWQNKISQGINEQFFFKSNRIREMLFLICRECTSKEIALRMNISEKTVEKYRAQLIKITGARNVVGLVLYAFSQNIHADIGLQTKFKL